MKKGIGRTRPNGGLYSYPSGHTSSSFATAAVVYEHFGPIFGVPAFLGATYIGLSRLQGNKHYASDVIAGAALGTYIGFKIAGRHGGRLRSIGFAPIDGGEGVGLSLSIPF